MKAVARTYGVIPGCTAYRDVYVCKNRTPTPNDRKQSRASLYPKGVFFEFSAEMGYVTDLTRADISTCPLQEFLSSRVYNT